MAMKFRTERKRTLTLNLSDEEMTALEGLADRQGMSKSAVLRQALRVYHTAVLETGSLSEAGCVGDG
jgi:predicted transcriptional regulator